ncbi:MAG: TonB-dependent receptor [bacterium]|nr:TonB-dependent receptor [bacterium]
MRRNSGFVAAVATLLLAMPLVAPDAFGQTTGRIEGQVVGVEGSAFPGVTITATSDSLQGPRVVVTDSNGNFRFPTVPPGVYTIKAELDTFTTLEREGVKVGIDRTATIAMQMAPATVSDQIIVTSETPLVDTQSSSSGVNITDDLFDQIPLGRDFYKVAQVAAGTGEDREGTTISGATSVENQYIVEGLNTTGVELGQQKKALNFEFIEEVQVITGGLPAEYGRITGGVVSAITKSGGNTYKGDAFGYFEDPDLKADNSTQGDLRDDAFQVVEITDQQDIGFDLGGYFVKDKLWFFGAFNRVENTERKTLIRDIPVPGGNVAGDTVDTDFETDLWAGKLTWSANSSNTLTMSAFSDKGEEAGDVANFDYQQIDGPPSTYLGNREFGGTDYIGRWDGVFGSSLVAEAAFGTHNEEDKISGPGKSIVHIIDQSVSGSPTSGGFGFHQDTEFERDVLKLNVSKFLGDHEFKLGADEETVSAVNANWNGGAGQRIYIRPLRTDQQHYRHRFYVDDEAPGFDADDPSTWTLLAPLVSTPETTNTSYFAQDSWRATPNLTANIGARFERQEIGDRFGVSQIDLDDNWAARLGVVWDVKKDGRSKLFANYGRYFLSIPMDINIRAFGGEVQCFCYNFSPDPADFAPDPDAPENSRLLGAGGTPVDPSLSGQYVDDYLIGFEYEVRPDLVVGVQASYRDLGRVVEDFLVVEEGDYFIANPGEGLGTAVTFYDYYYSAQYNYGVDYGFPNGDPITDFTAPVTSPTREYTSVQFTARKRFSNNWQLLGNYVWSQLEGDYDGAFQVSTGQLDPTINSAFDYADFLVNADGDLSLNREHQFRVDGSYRFSEGKADGLTIGASASFKSGFPLNAYGYSSAYNNHELYLVPRGSLGSGPDLYEIDVHFGYPVKAGNFEVNFLLDIFNLLDRQKPFRLDERFNRPEDGHCADDGNTTGIDLDLCNNMGGIRNVTGTLDALGAVNPGDSTNPNFLTKAFRSTDYSGQRTARIGVRLSW